MTQTPPTFTPRSMTDLRLGLPAVGLTALLMLGGCNASNPLDWDLRTGANSGDTSVAAVNALDQRPLADARGVISYPTYQVALAQRNDTVMSVANRVGIPPDQLASYNALRPADTLRAGEILALPTRVAAVDIPTTTGGVIGETAAPGRVDVSTIATTALNRVDAQAPSAPKTIGQSAEPQTLQAQPVRHQVQRGETAFTIARLYGVPVRSLGEWNSLGTNLEVREGQYLIIPTSSAPPANMAAQQATAPGKQTPLAPPPSAKKPLPAEKTVPAAEASKPTVVADLGKERTAASASAFEMPVQGKIIRSYVKKKNDGIDIAAPAGTVVKSAADGVVAAITKDTTGTPIVVIRHADGILTVYAGVDGLKVAKGAAVKRGQTIAVVRNAEPAFVHFEVRKGVDSVDPMSYLQ
ncbi:peptidoglycan DD-metalloendopeptidase family protein [Cypionkella sp.]|uniref:peptidoglycan DD-metalloendopeptidase family protein n=1 Tax=Cypionkella sp. TaxID=2811411 RepID=UPI0037521B7A